jgi:hypothetical protein
MFIFCLTFAFGEARAGALVESGQAVIDKTCQADPNPEKACACTVILDSVTGNF